MSLNSISPLAVFLTEIISETNGIGLEDTLELLVQSDELEKFPELLSQVQDFQTKLAQFQMDQLEIEALLDHPVGRAFFEFFQNFPITYHDEHTHLTGALTPEFIFPRLKNLLNGPQGEAYAARIKSVFQLQELKFDSAADVLPLIQVKEHERFERYLQVLTIPQLLFTSRQAHREAALHIAESLYHRYNIGRIRIKFTLSRMTSDPKSNLPGMNSVTPEDVVMGLFEGFMEFRKKVPQFDFVLSPSFRKEAHFFDSSKFRSKKEHFEHQVKELLALLERFPELSPYLCEVDTVGDEINHYRKEHFNQMRVGFRRLQYKGFKIRSHHGETWRTLKKGIQAIDNAMNIWHVDTLEHGLALGINPNSYFHSLYQRVIRDNRKEKPLAKASPDFEEVQEMEWNGNTEVPQKLFDGLPLNEKETIVFLKAKFHTAREVEHYQHDVLNRLIDKEVSLVSLPSSNRKLTGHINDYKDHPFSWWEKKGLRLGVGTDNYVTLNTNYIRELLILLFTDSQDLKITKLLMIATGERRRPYLSQLLWRMRKQIQNSSGAAIRKNQARP